MVEIIDCNRYRETTRQVIAHHPFPSFLFDIKFLSNFGVFSSFLNRYSSLLQRFYYVRFLILFCYFLIANILIFYTSDIIFISNYSAKFSFFYHLSSLLFSFFLSYYY